jgi:O-acetyl-ADP-ribose deacetylase (regulator of RNase III)
MPMITITRGDLLAAPAEALVNTVNTEGAMGKGVALQFRQAYPQMYKAYERACEAGEVQLGKMHVYDLGGLAGGPRWIINFPTKAHWRSRSRLDSIEAGLADLVEIIQRLNIHSIAIPPLGCGHGGLDWTDVRPRIEKAFESLPEVNAILFEPIGAPAAKSMRSGTHRPKMTSGQAALIALMDRYLKGLLDPFVTLLEIHKLMYFLRASGEPLEKLNFVKHKYGPYSPNLRHGLIRMENHLLRGFGDGEDTPHKPIELLAGAVEEATSFLQDHQDTHARIDRVVKLIEGFEDPYGMELLSSMHWVMCHEPGLNSRPDMAIAAVHDWSPRKRKKLHPDHLLKAWLRIKEQGWDTSCSLEASQAGTI